MIFSQYDDIADKYDELFLDDYSMNENKEVSEMLQPTNGYVLDVGCGTGLLTEICDIPSDMYLGIDPSEKMLQRFRKKHPSYRYLVCSSFDGVVVNCCDFDYLISLFGSPSYLSRDVLVKISNSNIRLFMMFYKYDYFPVTYKKCNVNFRHYSYTKQDLCDVFGGNNVRDYHNYIIISR